MRRVPAVLYFCIAVSAILGQSSADSPAGSVVHELQGQVLDAVTQTPVANAHIRLVRRPGGTSTTSTTAEGGIFRVSNVEGGSYSIVVTATGYLPLIGYERSQTASIELDQSRSDLLLKLTPLAAVSGRVVDADGHPISHAEVSVWAVNRREKEHAWSRLISSVTTNQNGIYRVKSLVGGRVCLRASVTGKSKEPGGQVFYDTFYPATTEPELAEVINITPGLTLQNVDIKLVSGWSSRAVSGSVFGDEPATVSLCSDYLVSDCKFASTTKKNPVFTFRRITPGTFNLTAKVGAADSSRWALVHIVVGVSDVANVALIPEPGASIRGTVSLAQSSEHDFSQTFLRFRCTECSPGIETVVRIEPSGSFDVQALPPGRYTISSTRLPEGTFLRGIEINGTTAVDSTIDLSSTRSAQIQVDLERGAGEIAGQVLSSDGSVAVGKTNIMVVGSKSGESGYNSYIQTTTDDFGRFIVKNVMPGVYVAIASELPDVYLESYLDDEFQMSEPFAAHVKVEPNKACEVKVRLW